ncbi:MAG: hypothetical protein HY059_09105 [Proteobacteria bacterium]|nr:hypothetical protein [Pseudomonadota bacterium]
MKNTIIIAAGVLAAVATQSWARCGGDPECYREMQERAIQRQIEEAREQRLRGVIVRIVPAADVARIQRDIEAARGNATWIEAKVERTAAEVKVTYSFRRHLGDHSRVSYPAYVVTAEAAKAEGFDVRTVAGKPAAIIDTNGYETPASDENVESGAKRAYHAIVATITRQKFGALIDSLEPRF